MKILKLSFIIFFIFSLNNLEANSDDMKIKITKNLRCLICQGQSVYDSDSEFANSLKLVVDNKINEGLSEKQIYSYFQSKYGDWILYDPLFNRNTYFLWLLPLLIFFVGGAIIFNKFIKKQMKTKGILSYLYYQDGEVLIDEFSPKERLGEFLNNETKFYSMSMGKSVTSYLVGHAICEGYIDGVDARVNDWPIIKDSLYHDQKLINFLNMNTGDQKYIDEFDDGTSKLGAYEDRDIETTMRSHFRNKNTKKSKDKYNYNGFVTQLILNYMKFKIGEDYDKFYSKVFNDKIKIKNSIRYGYTSFQEKNGNGHPNIMATRFDYLRIAKAIMDDYQNDTCVGKYLKEIHKRRIPKGSKEKEEPAFNRTKSYGGQFHMDFPGLKENVVFGMSGYGGNFIAIDMENSRILVVNSLHYNNKKYKYNHKKLLYDPFK